MTLRRRQLAPLLAAALIVTSCVTSPPDPSASATEIEVRITPYPYNADRYGEDLPVEIGRFDVPAVRGGSDSALFELGFLRYPAVEGIQGAPYVVLTEQPAAEALSQQQISELRESGDIIIFNRRGYGFSSPPPPCPGRINYPFERALEPGLLSELSCAYVRSCLDALAEEGFDPQTYSDKEAKADLDDLMAALGTSRIRLIDSDNIRPPEMNTEIEVLAERLSKHPEEVTVASRSGRSIRVQIGELDLAFLRFNNLVANWLETDRLDSAVEKAASGEFAELGSLALEMRQQLSDLSSIAILRLESVPTCQSIVREDDSAYVAEVFAAVWPELEYSEIQNQVPDPQ